MKILHLYFLPLPFSQKRYSVWDVCLESYLREHSKIYSTLAKPELLQFLPWSAHFYEHTFLRSWEILLRSVSLLKVTLTHLAGLVYVSDTLRLLWAYLCWSMLQRQCHSLVRSTFTLHMFTAVTPLILILAWTNLNLQLKVEQQICCESMSCILCFFRAMS